MSRQIGIYIALNTGARHLGSRQALELKQDRNDDERDKLRSELDHLEEKH